MILARGLTQSVCADAQTERSTEPTPWRPTRTLGLFFQESIGSYEIGKLAPRCNADLRKNVRKVSADGSRRDIESRPDLLVRFSQRDHARDFGFTSSETGGARCNCTRGRA